MKLNKYSHVPSFIKYQLLIFILAIFTISEPVYAQRCPPGSLLNTSTQTCAPINDARSSLKASEHSKAIVPNLIELRNKKAKMLGVPARGTPVFSLESISADQDIPIPAASTGWVGTAYLGGELQALDSAILYTTMFVHPDGVNPSSNLDWLFTTATNRTEKTLEIVGIYSGDNASIGVFDWSCSSRSPCPNIDPTQAPQTSASWQWTRPFSDFACNMTEILDAGGHYQTVMQYANQSEKVKSNWVNSALFWNYCNSEWDLVYEHKFKANQADCSIDSCIAGWWGPILETFGDVAQPQIKELGFADTILMHDNVGSLLSPTETSFRDPVSPWLLLHHLPNRAFTAGNFVDISPVRITFLENQTSSVGDSVLLQIEGRHVDGLDISYEATGLPGDLVIDSTTGLITGTVNTVPSVYKVTVTVLDSIGNSNSITFDWTISEAPALSCTDANLIILFTSFGGGQGPSVNETLAVSFIGNITNPTAGNTTTTIEICSGTTVEFTANSTSGVPACTVNNSVTAPSGTLQIGDSLTCTNKPDGSDTDTFKIRSGG